MDMFKTVRLLSNVLAIRFAIEPEPAKLICQDSGFTVVGVMVKFS